MARKLGTRVLEVDTPEQVLLSRERAGDPYRLNADLWPASSSPGVASYSSAISDEPTETELEQEESDAIDARLEAVRSHSVERTRAQLRAAGVNVPDFPAKPRRPRRTKEQMIAARAERAAQDAACRQAATAGTFIEGADEEQAAWLASIRNETT